HDHIRKSQTFTALRLPSSGRALAVSKIHVDGPAFTRRESSKTKSQSTCRYRYNSPSRSNYLSLLISWTTESACSCSIAERINLSARCQAREGSAAPHDRHKPQSNTRVLNAEPG